MDKTEFLKETALVHEYIIVYAKNIHEAPLLEKEKPGVPFVFSKAKQLKNSGLAHKEAQKQFAQWINQSKLNGKIGSGEHQFKLLHPTTFRPFRGASTGAQNKVGKPLYTKLLHPITGKPCKSPVRGWKWSASNLEKLSEYKECVRGSHFVIAGGFCYGRDETTVPRRIIYLDEHIKQTPRSVLCMACNGSRDLPSGLKFFTPKPIHLIKELISYYPKKDAIVLDYFAGSAATAQAVHELNKQDKGTRSWIIIEEMKSTFRDVIIPRLRNFDPEGNFGIYETKTSSQKSKEIAYHGQDQDKEKREVYTATA